MTNSPRYALSGAIQKDVCLGILGTRLGHLLRLRLRVDVDLSTIPIIFVSPAATVDFIRRNMAQDSPIIDPSVIISRFRPTRLAESESPKSNHQRLPDSRDWKITRTLQPSSVVASSHSIGDHLLVAVRSEEADDWMNAANAAVLLVLRVCDWSSRKSTESKDERNPAAGVVVR